MFFFSEIYPKYFTETFEEDLNAESVDQKYGIKSYDYNPNWNQKYLYKAEQEFLNFSKEVVQKFIIKNIFETKNEITMKEFVSIFEGTHEWIFDINKVKKVY